MFWVRGSTYLHSPPGHPLQIWLFFIAGMYYMHKSKNRNFSSQGALSSRRYSCERMYAKGFRWEVTYKQRVDFIPTLSLDFFGGALERLSVVPEHLLNRDLVN